MSIFKSILGKARAAASAISATISREEKPKSAASPASLTSSMFRGRERQAAPQPETTQPQARTSPLPIKEPVTFAAGSATANNLFSSMFRGATPAVPALTFQPPSVPVGDAASVFEMMATGQMQASEAQKVLAERDIYTRIDETLGGILPGGEPFTFKPTTVAIIALVAVLGGAFLLSRRN